MAVGLKPAMRYARDVNGLNIGNQLFLVGLVACMAVGFFFGQSLERAVEYRQVVSLEVTLNSEFVIEEENRGVSHRDVMDSYAQAVDSFARALSKDLGAGSFSSEVSASRGLVDLVRMLGLMSGDQVSETELDDAIEVIAEEYQFKPIQILDTRIEKQELRSGIPGWQLGALGSIVAGLIFSMSVILANTLRTVMKSKS